MSNQKNQSQRPTLEEIIEDIVAHCSGVPLSVKGVMIAHLKNAIASELKGYRDTLERRIIELRTIEEQPFLADKETLGKVRDRRLEVDMRLARFDERFGSLLSCSEVEPTKQKQEGEGKSK